MKMAFGNGLGCAFDESWTREELFAPVYGSFIAELSEDLPVGRLLGRVTGGEPRLSWQGSAVSLDEVYRRYHGTLEKVYPTLNPEWDEQARREFRGCAAESRPADRTEAFLHEAKAWPAPAVKIARPRVLIPAFPGTNCEYDSARAAEDAGAEAEIFVIRNRRRRRSPAARSSSRPGWPAARSSSSPAASPAATSRTAAPS